MTCLLAVRTLLAAMFQFSGLSYFQPVPIPAVTVMDTIRLGLGLGSVLIAGLTSTFFQAVAESKGS